MQNQCRNTQKHVIFVFGEDLGARVGKSGFRSAKVTAWGGRSTRNR